MEKLLNTFLILHFMALAACTSQELAKQSPHYNTTPTEAHTPRQTTRSSFHHCHNHHHCQPEPRHCYHREKDPIAEYQRFMYRTMREHGPSSYD